MSDLPLVSVIIPHRAGTEVLLACLESIERDRSYPHYEIVLVDNGSTDDSVAEARRRFPALRVIRLEENQGYAGGCNRGIEATRGRYVVLLNDDAEVEPGWLRELVQAAEDDPSVGACQPKIRALPERSRFEYSGAAGGLMDLYGYPFSRGRLMDHVEEDRGQYDDPIEVFWASGVCMLIRRAALEDAGAFDEVFFAYMEEIDLCWRIRLQGFRVVYVPSAVVYHIGGYSLDKRVPKRMYLNHRNSLLMLLKNYSLRSLLWILPVKVALEGGIALGALLRNPPRSRAILRAFAWIGSHLPTVARLRADVQRRRRVPDREIFAHLYLGMAPLWYFVFGIRQVPDLPDIDRVLHQPYRPDHKPPEGEVIRPQRRNFLYAYLDQTATALALMRAVECERFAELSYRRPVLDLGCGNGTFARMLFNGVIVDAAVDADPRACERARATRCYGEVEVGRLERLPLETGTMATVFANGVLGRARDADLALREIHRVLRPGGRLYLTVPNPACLRELFWARWLARRGLRKPAERYARAVLRAFGVAEVHEPDAWEDRLREAAFEVERSEPYMPPRAARLQDLFLPPSGFAALAQWLRRRNLWLPRLHRLVVRLYRAALVDAVSERSQTGTGTFLVARRAGDAD